MKRFRMVVLVGLLLLSAPVAMLGQAVSATMLGSVTDPSGAAVPNAKVTVTQTDTGVTHDSLTNGSGNYTFPDLKPGSYTVTVEASGFKKTTHQNVDLLVNSSTRLDLDMALGSATETVLVTTAPALLQTDRADISTKIEVKQIADLPLGTNRNFQSLLNLVPGTSPATFQHSQFFNAQSSLQTQVNGLPRMGNVYQIEGIDDNERTGLLQIIIPPAEAIQSVDISTNNFEAELGRATGAVTNVILKSGSNSFHGSAFEFIQNNAVNARSYFGGPLGHLSYNYFGGSIGGPIWKDKLFFFGDYLRTTDHEKISNTFTIPPPQFYTPVNGFIDLSAPLNTATGAGQVYDPTTGDGVATARTAFANNQIPIGKVNPVSLRFLQALGKVAQPNQNTANLANPSNNFVTNLPFTKETNSFDVKLDFALSSKDHLSGRYSYQKVNTFQAPAFGSFLGGPAGGGFQGTGTQTAYSTGLNYDHTFSPTLLTEMRFGVAHLRNNAQPSDYGTQDATDAGVPGVNLGGQPFTTGQVGITLGIFSAPLFGYSASVPWIRGESNIDFINVWTKVLKNHTIKAGVDVRRVRDDLLQDQTFSPRGAFTFGENQTSNSGKITNVANDMASFLLDVPNQVGRDLNTFFPAYRQWWFFAFASDKWQATSKLTVDMGLRWEFYPPATPRIAGGFSNYDPAGNNLVISGVGGNPNNLGMKTQYKNFAPRTGFSYRVTDSTVIRGGFGISYTSFPDNLYAYNYPIRANNSYQPSGSNSSYGPAVLGDGVTVATFQAGFPAPVPISIPANGIIPATTSSLVSQQYYAINLNYKNPYVEAWNVAIQQALPGSISLQLAYVANHGVAISGNQNINNPSAYGGGSASSPEYNCVGCPSNLHRTAATNFLYQGFSSNYQSLQVQLTRRFTQGLGFTSAFTWGKGLGYISGDDGGLIYYINQRRNYAPLDFDRTLNFEQSFTYELPVGRGHKLLSSGIGAATLGGWRLSGTVSAVTGTPFTVYANGGTLNTPGTAQTANLVGPYKVLGGIGPGNQWFDKAAFPNTTPGANSGQPTGCTGQTYPNCIPGLGNTGRNQFRGPGYVQNNLSIFKVFPILREAALEARFEAFQLSNTPQFNNPNSGTGSIISAGNFGQITSTLGSGQGSVNGVGGGRTLQASAKITF
ncbi:hypothetical protein BH10ACI4_BH10ACI4_13650 [soil metagenome]